MITPQNLALAVVSWLTRLLIYFTAVMTAISLLFGTPHVIKRTLVETKAYERFVPATIEANVRGGQPSSSLPLADEEVQKILIKSFPARDLQIKTEATIDSIYVWLNGATEQPEYKIDFGPNVDLLADEMSVYLINKVAFLPGCFDQPTEFDPLTTKCKPEPFDVIAERQELAKQIRENNGLLPKTVYTAKDLPRNQAGKTVIEQYPQIPTVFRLFKLSPIFLGLLTLLCGVTVLWLSRSKRRALKQLGTALISNGVFLCLSPIFFIYVLPQFAGGLQTGFGAHGAQTVSDDVSRMLNNKLSMWLLIVGALVTALGLAIRLLERGTRPQSPYGNVKKKSGLISSIQPRSGNGRFKLDPAKVPLQSSEISVTKARKRKRDKKYRKIPKDKIL